MPDNPLSALNLTAEEVNALASQEVGSRRTALSLLRRYYGLLFHPDRHNGTQHLMERVNGAIDALETSIEPYRKTYAASQAGSLRTEREKWLESRIKEEQQRAAAAIGECRRSNEALEAAKSALSRDIAGFEGERQRLKSIEPLSSQYYHELFWYRQREQELRPLPYPATVFKIVHTYIHRRAGGETKVTKYRELVLRPEGIFVLLKNKRHQYTWEKLGFLVGFLTAEHIEANNLPTTFASDNITVNSDRFIPILKGLSEQPTSGGGIVVGLNHMLRLYGRLKKWDAYSSLSD